MKKGEALLRLTDDPRWVEKQKDADKYQKVVDDLKAAESLGPLSPAMEASRAEAQTKLDAWKAERKQAPAKTLRAPIAGVSSCSAATARRAWQSSPRMKSR